MDTRRYLKRVWRVPKDRGASTYLAAIVLKALRKHGWPAEVEILTEEDGFFILHFDHGDDHPKDFRTASEIAVRIAARTYRVDVTHSGCTVLLDRPYAVTKGGHFTPIKE